MELQQRFQALTVRAGSATAASFPPQMWRMHRNKRSADPSVVMLTIWIVIPFINLAHVWFQRDWYLGFGLGIGWLACLLTLGQALYDQRQAKHHIAQRTQQNSAPAREENA